MLGSKGILPPTDADVQNADRRPACYAGYPLLKQLLSVADGRFSYPENGIKIHKRQFFFRGNHGIITLSAGLLQRMMIIWAGADNTIQEGQ